MKKVKRVFEGYEIEIVDLKNARAVEEIRQFLANFDLTFDCDVEYTVTLRAGDKLVGTGSFAGEVLRNIAVDETVQGSGLTATLVSHLMQEAARRGRMHYFIFTRPVKAWLFEALGFREIARAEPYVALLETGIGSIESFCQDVQRQAAHLKKERAAIVVNCNPFTQGHRALIERAASENEAVIVFVVSEDRSLFPFADRFRLVKEGVDDLKNVVVVPAGPYIISAATFPTYFTRGDDQVAAQTRLDLVVFAARIAPALNIKTRYVGEEPYCAVTNSYNGTMLEILPRYDITVKVIPRVAVNGDIVSASKVRELIRQDDWDGIKKVVPETTYRYLTSKTAKEIVEKIRHSDSRH